jgi:hypothetical protein
VGDEVTAHVGTMLTTMIARDEDPASPMARSMWRGWAELGSCDPMN